MVSLGLAHNIVDNQEFRNVLRAATGKTMAPISRGVHNNYIEADFSLFCETLTEALVATTVLQHGVPFVCLFHGIYLDNAGRSILGASIAFIDTSWKLQHVAVVGKSHAGTHAASVVSSAIQALFRQRYHLDLMPITKFVMSDTTGTKYSHLFVWKFTDIIG